MSCYGNEVVQTPVLEEFAARSTQFNQAYSSVPLCTPYRACLFTGLYPSQNGVKTNGVRLPDELPTVAQHLSDAGYDTRYIGKWHLGGAPHGNRWVPPDNRGGFQHFIGWESHHANHNKGLIWYDDPDQAIGLRGHETDGLTDIVCEELEKVAGQNDSEPFFMTVAYQAPHPPCSPPQEFKDLYDSSVLSSGRNTDSEAWFKNIGWVADYGIEEFRRLYFGEITQMDAAFGRILESLKQTGLDEDTVVIFTSDHGEMAGCHGLFGKNVMFDESVRVPLLIHVPGQTPHTTDSPASTVDLHATLLDLAGVSSVPSEGRSLLPALRQENDPHDIFIEGTKEDCIIRGSLKVVMPRDQTEVSQCFELALDPYELKNLAECSPEAISEYMVQALLSWRNRTRPDEAA